VGTEPRTHLASFSLASQSLLPWSPKFNGAVLTMQSSGSILYTGGIFTTVFDYPSQGIAALSRGGISDVPAMQVLPEPKPELITANPVRESAIVGYNLPRADFVSLHIVSLSGRLVRTILEKQWSLEGSHSVRVDTHSLANGMYFVRLVSASGVASSKLVVAR